MLFILHAAQLQVIVVRVVILFFQFDSCRVNKSQQPDSVRLLAKPYERA